MFSIIIPASLLAAGQMGPRLLRNFIRDRGNQFTLGAFLGIFCYTHKIRQNASGCVSVLARMLEVLGAVASCEHRGDRTRTLRRLAGLVLADARREIVDSADLADLISRHNRFETMVEHKAAGCIGGLRDVALGSM